MKILKTEFADFGNDFGDQSEIVAVTAQSEKGETNVFFVQLFQREHSADCQITVDGDRQSEIDGYVDFDDDDYAGFDDDAIVAAAQKLSKENFNDNFKETEIEFNCSIADESVYMQVDRATGNVRLVIKDEGAFDPYRNPYALTDLNFDSEKEALEYADKFRTGEHQDINGLYNFLADLRENRSDA